MAARLSTDYLVIDTSFEGLGDSLFQSEENFCKTIFKIFASSISFRDKANADFILQHADNIKNFQELSESITKLNQESHKRIVLLIDEVDKNSNSKVFMQFLGVLRNKYLAAKAQKDITFQSVILAGIHDIKNLKLAIRDENEARFNSPWNIASKFDMNMSLSDSDIKSMLIDYQNENKTDMDIELVSSEIFALTSGWQQVGHT